MTSFGSNLRWALPRVGAAYFALAILSAIPFIFGGNPFDEPPYSRLSYLDVQVVYLKLAILGIPLLAGVRPFVTSRWGLGLATALSALVLTAFTRYLLRGNLPWSYLRELALIVTPVGFVLGSLFLYPYFGTQLSNKR